MTDRRDAFHPETFLKDSARALHDVTLGASVRRAQDFLRGARTDAKEKLPGFEALRDQAKKLRNAALENMGPLLERLEANIQRRGGSVHWARDASEARAIVGSLCRSVNARTIVKSKSMVSEEIGLTRALKAEGYRVFETDLGEYIVQIRDEHPSHMVMPALHLNRETIAQDFRAEHTQLPKGRPLDSGLALVREARGILRKEFAVADVGITGANFLLAEPGAAVLCTNEGNADLTAELPLVHIVVTGIEKVVPDFNAAALLIRLLARSATGQAITAYTSIFTGPRLSGESSGPKAFHLVLVDNGRSNMLGTEFQDMLRCIRCGACLNHCPIYRAVGGNGYASVYSGPMGAVLTPALVGIKRAKHLPEASTLCGRCEEVCPVRIPLPKMLRNWREQEFERNLATNTARIGLGVWAFLARHPVLYRLVIRCTSYALRRLQSDGWVDKLPIVGGGWTKYRDLRCPMSRSFQQQWAGAFPLNT